MDPSREMLNLELSEGSSQPQQALNFLDLPVEVLERVFYFSDPNTVYIALFICKRVKHVIESSRQVLARQLQLLPGVTSYIASSTTGGLQATFKSRANRFLCGASVFCDTVRYEVDHPYKINCKESIFDRKLGTLLVVFHGQRDLRVFRSQRGGVEMGAKLRPDHRELDSDDVRALKVAFSTCHDVLALYGSVKGSFIVHRRHRVHSTWETSQLKCLKLVTFHYCRTALKESFYTSGVQDTMDIVHPTNYQPVGLAGSDVGYVAVSWQDEQNPGQILVTLYLRHKQLMERTNYGEIPGTRCHLIFIKILTVVRPVP